MNENKSYEIYFFIQNYFPKLISTFGNRTYWFNGMYHRGIDIVADINGVSEFDCALTVTNEKI